MDTQPEKRREKKKPDIYPVSSKETIGTMVNSTPLWHYNSQREQVFVAQ
jgi:hypothetical protein